MESVINDFVEIVLAQPDDFLKVKETLSRIGTSSKTEKILYQSCHIFHKQGRYYIVHFKELFKLDGKMDTLTENDIARRNTICDLLEQWGLVTILTPEKIAAPRAPVRSIKILPFTQKKDWEIRTKYSIGGS